MLFAFEGGPKDGDTRNERVPIGLGDGYRLRLHCTDPTCGARPNCPDEWYQVTDRQLATAAGPATVVVYVGEDEMPPESALD